MSLELPGPPQQPDTVVPEWMIGAADRGPRASVDSPQQDSERWNAGAISRALEELVPRAAVLGIRATAVALNFAVQLVMAHVMHLSEFGVTNTALAIMNVAVVPAALGYDSIAVRFVALVRGDRSSLTRLTSELVRGVALGSVVVCVALAAIAISERYTDHRRLADAVAMLLLIVPGFALVQVAEGWLRGYGSIVRAQVSSAVVVPGLSIAFLLAAALIPANGHVSAIEGLAARALATAIAVGIVITFVIRKMWSSRSNERALVLPTSRQLRLTSLGLCGTAAVTIVLMQADLIVVSYVRGPAAAGIYSASSRIAFALNVTIVSINFILAPRISRLFAERRTRELQSEIVSAARWAGALMGISCLGAFIASGLLLRMFGTSFGPGETPLRILLAGQFVNGLCGPVGAVLNMTGNQQKALRALVTAAVCDILLLIALVPEFGLVGAACATTAATALWNLMMVAYVRRTVGVSIFAR